MTTRCMVFFQDDEFPTSKPEKVRMYVHADGYPSNMAKDLADFFAKYNEVYPSGSEYQESGNMAAQFLHFTMERSFRSTVQSATRRLKRAKAEDDEYGIKSAEEMLERNRNFYRYLGYRIVPHDEFHSDIEWLYVVTPTRVHVYHTQHNKRGGYNDFEARHNKDNWILVTEMHESWDIRHGVFPERFNEVSNQDLYLQRVEEFLDEEKRTLAAQAQLSLCPAS